MSKRSSQPTPPPTRYDTTRLVVWGEQRKEPDWDTFIAALLAWALRQVEDDAASPDGGDDG
jgi:hypothetical protein